ncbi:Plasmodium exported protein, unknown function, pseudogene [Plasmodium malariae]|uniref:Fam-m protein n=1 Tax=Plasmodium malariae TaxID=5858 RepID=A0A1D3TDN7_PLAMA|nr:Plasmodium exported protein, unknown function, pseudogene [Plasmodium malariae]SCP03017.1 Plasmodium exported protein, unknown function, pseudogene [Plasmodium malariae]
MEEKIKLLFYFKIITLLLLIWICNFYNYMVIQNKYLDKGNYIDEKVWTRTNRLLAKHKYGKCSNIVWIKHEIPYNGEYEKKDMSNNEKVSTGKYKLLNECSLNNKRDYGKSGRSKSSARNARNSYFGKRMLDKIYYKNKLRAAINSDFNFLRKDISQKVVMLTVLYSFTIIFALLIFILRYIFLKKGEQFGISNSLNIHSTSIALLVIAIIVIPVMIYIGKKMLCNVKYIYKKCEINNTAYPSFSKVLFL